MQIELCRKHVPCAFLPQLPAANGKFLTAACDRELSDHMTAYHDSHMIINPTSWHPKLFKVRRQHQVVKLHLSCEQYWGCLLKMLVAWLCLPSIFLNLQHACQQTQVWKTLSLNLFWAKASARLQGDWDFQKKRSALVAVFHSRFPWHIIYGFLNVIFFGFCRLPSFPLCTVRFHSPEETSCSQLRVLHNHLLSAETKTPAPMPISCASPIKGKSICNWDSFYWTDSWAQVCSKSGNLLPVWKYLHFTFNRNDSL